MKDTILAIIIAISGGAAGASVVNMISERLKFRAERKAKKEDRLIEKNDKTDEISEAVEAMKVRLDKHEESFSARFSEIDAVNVQFAEALKVILLDRIRNLGQKYIKDGVVDFDDRRIFHMMHNVYHNGLGGNGDADLIVAAVDELPLKN